MDRLPRHGHGQPALARIHGDAHRHPGVVGLPREHERRGPLERALFARVADGHGLVFGNVDAQQTHQLVAGGHRQLVTLDEGFQIGLGQRRALGGEDPLAHNLEEHDRVLTVVYGEFRREQQHHGTSLSNSGDSTSIIVVQVRTGNQ
jgi:hypothetical protein